MADGRKCECRGILSLCHDDIRTPCCYSLLQQPGDKPMPNPECLIAIIGIAVDKEFVSGDSLREPVGKLPESHRFRQPGERCGHSYVMTLRAER